MSMRDPRLLRSPALARRLALAPAPPTARARAAPFAALGRAALPTAIPSARNNSTTAAQPQEAASRLFGEPAPPPELAAPQARGEGALDAAASQGGLPRLRQNAIDKLRSLREDLGVSRSVLRLTVNSGGCSGYSYEFSMVDDTEDVTRADDVVLVETDGARMVVDEVSLEFLEDCEVDYVEEMIRASFLVVKNKLADAKCGCGSSFSVSAF